MMWTRVSPCRKNLTPEEDAARFVLAWERWMIRNGRAWRRPNPNGATYKGSRVFTWLALPYWTRHFARLDPAYGEPVSVPQSVLVPRPEGCKCQWGAFASGVHDFTCPLRPPSDRCLACGGPFPCCYHDGAGRSRTLAELEAQKCKCGNCGQAQSAGVHYPSRENVPCPASRREENAVGER